MRVGKRLTGLTEPGEQVLPIVERLLQEAENLKRAADDFASAGSGRLRIAATHSQARYALPPRTASHARRAAGGGRGGRGRGGGVFVV